jgi:hypothetical protein
MGILSENFGRIISLLKKNERICTKPKHTERKGEEVPSHAVCADSDPNIRATDGPRAGEGGFGQEPASRNHELSHEVLVRTYSRSTNSASGPAEVSDLWWREA